MAHRDEMEPNVVSPSVPLEGGSLPRRAWTFVDVQDRLVEALLTCWRLPDRERRWSRGASDGPWHLVMDEAEYDGGRDAGVARVEAAMRPASLTRREVDEMEEAFGWVDALEPGERRLVAAAITDLARGRREIGWARVAKRFGLSRGADGLRMRYGRSISRIAARLNGGNPRANVSISKM